MGQHEENNNNAEKILLAVENGRVKISDTSGEGVKGALIRPGQGISVKVNNQEITGSQEVYPGDKVEITPLEETEPDRVEVKVSADGMKAHARYLPGIRRYYVIPDHPYTDDLTVEGEPKEEPLKNLTPEQILETIKENGVNFGIDESLLPVLLEESETWQTVASGKPVVQGKNGWVEPLFEGAVKAVSYDDEANRVDLRRRFEIEEVNKDDVIANIHPPVPGEAGKRVTGEDIQPDPVFPVEIKCDHGTALSQDQTKVIATCTGAPSYKKGRTPKFRVDDLYTQKGDVDIKSGNIDFRGHLKVQGGINEGMKVSADGNLEVEKNASGAEVLAGGSIILKGNCIKCKVRAGWVEMVVSEIYETLDKMNDSVTSALAASEEVAKALEKKGKHTEKMEAAVVRSLLQSKFAELPEYANSLMKTVKAAGRSIPGSLAQLINDIAPYFTDYQYSQTLGRPVLQEIHDKLQQLKNDSSDEKSVRADITVPYVQNSELTATGNIIINGPGVYNSQIKCKDEVRVSRLFRGGTIEAGGDVYIGEAGSPRVSSEQGRIQVPYKSKVHLGNIYENVKIKFGNIEFRTEKPLSSVRLVLDQEEFEVKILPWEK